MHSFPGPSAYKILDNAKSLLGSRGKEYDKKEERSMKKTVEIFNLYTGKKLKESEGWLLQQILKDVRQYTKDEFHVDSGDDKVAYSALHVEALQKEALVKE